MSRITKVAKVAYPLDMIVTLHYNLGWGEGGAGKVYPPPPPLISYVIEINV